MSHARDQRPVFPTSQSEPPLPNRSLSHDSLGPGLTATAAILMLDTEGKILAADDRACVILGTSRDQLIHHSFNEFCVATNTFCQDFLSFPIYQSCCGQTVLIQPMGSPLHLSFLLVANVSQDVHLLALFSVPVGSGNATTAPVTAPPAADVACQVALHSTTEQLHLQNAALNACADVIVITDRHGTIEWANPAFTQLTGYLPAEAIGRNPSDLVNSGKQDEQFFRQLWRTILAGQVWRGEITNRRKDNTHYVEQMTITPVHNGTEEITHFVAIKQDITARKATEQRQQELTVQVNRYALALEQTNLALRQSEQRYRSVLETQTELLCRFSPEGILTFVNGAYCRFFNCSAEALVGRHFVDLVPPDQHPQVIEQIVELRQLTPDQPVMTHEHSVITPTGVVAWHRWINQALFDDQGQLVEFQASGRDITEYKRAEQALRDREHQLDLLFTQSLDGFFFMMLDEPIAWHDGADSEALLDYVFAHQRVTRANQAFLKQYGFSEADVLGLTPNDFFAHDLAAGRTVWRQLFNEGRLHIDTNEIRVDGTPIWVEGDYICLYDDQGRITGHFGVQREITELRDAVNALTESEQQYRLLVENQTDLVVKIDVDGHFVFVSPSYCELFGKTSEELLSKDFSPLIHPEDRAATQAAMAALWHPPYTCQLEQRALTQQGWRWIAWADTAIVDEAGNVTGVVGVGRDVTDRKLVEQELRLSEQRFRNVLETLTMVAIMLDPQGRIVFCNDYLLSLTGWQREEVLGQSWSELFLPEEIRSTLQTILVQTVESEEFPAYYENEIVTRTGDRRLIAWNNTVQHDPLGQVISLTSIGADITHRKRYETQVYELSQRLSLATHSAHIGVWELDCTTRAVVWDEHMYEIYAVPSPVTFDVWLLQCVHPEDRDLIAQSEAALRQGAEHTHMEFRIVRPDGSSRHVEAHTTAVRNADGAVQRLIGLNRDISDRKASEASIQALSERLTLATRAANLGIWEFIIATQQLFWDDRMLAMYGLTATTFGSRYSDWEALVLPEDLPAVTEQVNAAIAGHHEFHTEFRIRRPDGEIRHIEGHAVIRRDAAGQPRSMVGVNIDITDRRRNETILQETTQRLTLATDAAQLGVWEWDLASDRTFWDQRMHEIHGTTPETFSGLHADWIKMVHPDDLQFMEQEGFALRQGDSRFHSEFRIVRPTGAVRHLRSSGYFVRDAEGQVVRVIGVNEDISDRKQSELALAEAHQQLSALLQNSPIIIELFDETGRYERINPKTAELLNCTAADIEGRTFAEIHSPEVAALFMARIREIMDRNEPIVVEDRLRLQAQERILQSVAFPVLHRPPEPTLLGLVATDITDLVTAQENLRRQAERERLLRETTDNIRRSLDLDTILNSTVSGIRQFLATDRVLVYQFNPDWSGDVIVESVGSDWIAVLGHTLRDPCFTGKWIAPYRQGRVNQIADIETAPIEPCYRDFLRAYQVRANLVLPLVVNEQLWGLLCIHHCQTPRHWQTEEVDFVRQLADQVEIALHQAHLLTEAKKTAQQAVLRHRITQNIRSSLDLATILETTAQAVRESLQTDRVLINRFHAGQGATIIAQSTEPGWQVDADIIIHLPCIDESSMTQLTQGQLIQINDVHSVCNQQCDRFVLKQQDVLALLTLPLIVDGDLWGVMCIQHCRAARQWHPEEVTFVQQITDQVEIAVQQALLLQQTKIQVRREQVLNEIVSDIRDSLELDEIFIRATQRLRTEFQVSRCVIIRCTAQDDFFEYRACAVAPGSRNLQGDRVPLQDSPYLLKILAQETPQATTDVLQDAALDSLRPWLEDFDVRASLSVAIRHEGVEKGILCVHHAAPRQWSTHEQLLIKQVADQLAIAIQQAELYQQAQTEISERQRLEQRLRHDALHDMLTGLPNRALFLERLQLALQRYQRRQHQNVMTGNMSNVPTAFAVLFLDLDRFKVINDSLGHSFGDQLLQLVAERLTDCLREIDIAARLGGDEFVVLLEELTDFQFAIEVARRIHNVLEVPIYLNEREVFIRASIGITFGTSYHSTPEQILRDADIAMYEAKKNNREYVVFDASMHAIALEQMNLEHDLRHAINRNEFQLCFQPIVAIATGQISGFEALVRWQHPTRGLLYPGAFVEVAEETGLIAAIDLWVLQQACQQLSRWHRLSPDFADLTMSVNLSGKQFSQPDLIAQIDHALASAQLDGKHLKLEITESVLITNSVLAVQTLNQFRDRNIQVCMDDFGTGYSSLSYLHQFPVDILKVDKSFILNLNSPQADTRDYEIVKAIIHLALNLKLDVVAEGVENHNVLVYLQKNSCQFGQGYHFSPAIAADAATELLLNRPFQR